MLKKQYEYKGSYSTVKNYISKIKKQIVEEEPNKVPIFTLTLNMFEFMDNTTNTHLIKNIDNKLFDKLINEIFSVLN